MPYTQECASCKSMLRIPDNLRNPWLTCPRCLAKVMNPGSLAEGSQAPSVCPQCRRNNSPKAARCIYCGVDLLVQVIAPAAPAASDMMRCPYCAEDIPRSSRWCPRCKEKLTATGSYRLVDDVVQKDSTFIGRAMIPFAIVGAWGVGMFLLSADTGLGGPAKPFMGIAFVVVVALGFVLNSMKENKAATGIGRLILGGLAAAGAVVAAGLVLAFAALVYLFIVCATGGMKF